VLKSKIGTPLALAVLVALAGCAKKEPAADAAKAPEAVAATQPQMPAEHPVAAPAPEVDLSDIAKADGGKTVAEVFAEKDGLGGQKVTVRGKIVKVNAGIMNTNWLHVRDGSGAEGTNDLTVTTAGTVPNVGDTVLLTGTVALNKDFGMGYSYDVIVEDAEVTVEAASEM
jgi:predicted small lipoprotein YifL